MRPHLGKVRPIWAICTKNGPKCSRIGGEKFNHVGWVVVAVGVWMWVVVYVCFRQHQKVQVPLDPSQKDINYDTHLTLAGVLRVLI